jgi:sulfur-oxidizing protein SoxY
MRLKVVDRRDVLLGAGAGALVAAFLDPAALAQDRPPTLDDLLKMIMGDAKPADGKVAMELPEIAENGNTVPFSLSVDSPMTEAQHVKTIRIFATGNPQLDVATFKFEPTSGKAAVSSRMRLAKTQDVVALAELSDGNFLLSRRLVKVTIGGCGG